MQRDQKRLENLEVVELQCFSLKYKYTESK